MIIVKILAILKSPCGKGCYLLQKREPGWKDVFTPLAEDMKSLLTP